LKLDEYGFEFGGKLNIEVLIELLGSLGFYFLIFLSLVLKRGD